MQTLGVESLLFRKKDRIPSLAQKLPLQGMQRAPTLTCLTSLHLTQRNASQPLHSIGTYSCAHQDGGALVLQAKLGMREGSLPAVQVGILVRQEHLLEPGSLG